MVGIKDFEMPSCCNSCGHWSINRDDEPLCDLTYEYIRKFDKRQEDCPLVEAIPKDQYEARLKADLLAMLIELRQDIIAESWHIESLDINANDLYDLVVQISDVDKVIQQKINALKE